MSDKEQDYRIFIGGLSWDVTERQLETAFDRFGKVVDCQYKVMSDDGICYTADSSCHVMLERDTGRPRGFGFLTFADRRSMEDAIREMHGRELGDRVISVNKAQPKMGSEGPGNDYGTGYSSGGRGGGGGGYGRGGDRSAAGPDDCFKCGRPGHWARDCPSAGGGGGGGRGRGGGRPFTPPRSRYGGGGGGGRADRYADDRDRYVDDRYDRGRYGDRDRYDSRDDRYGGTRDRFVSDRYAPAGDRFAADRYGAASERYPQNGYGKDRAYDRDARGSGDRYGGGAGPPRYEGGRSYRDRPGPYDRPPRRVGRPPSLDRY